MTTPITPGAWCAGRLRATSTTWPFDWVSEITTVDAASRRHECVGKFIQSGARPKAEAQANLAALTRVPEMLRLLDAMVSVIDMSDPDHEAFVDSGADCLDELLRHEEALRAILVEFGLREPKPDDQD